MSDPRSTRRAGVTRALFVAFAACTLWLVVENSILVVVLPQLWAKVRAETRHE